MLFNSYVFILAFLPFALLGYFFLNKFAYGKQGQAGLLWLLVMSLGFYAYSDSAYVFLLLGGILVNYLLGTGIRKAKGGKGLLLGLGIAFNVGLLFYFKYYNFFMENACRTMGREWEWRNIFLPLGISFFTFRQLAYLIDCYRGQETAACSVLEYAVYVSFFPQLGSGPIGLQGELIPQFRDREKKALDYDNLAKGLYAFTLGLGKKVLLADNLAKLVTAGFSDLEGLNSGSALVAMLAYTLQLYFDFSGYSDMSLGVSLMFNFTTPFNFHSPYKARTIGEFWTRWHITLTRFFTQYVYIPLGGSRKGRVRTYVNTLLVFLLSGLWHGADWTFVVWGGLHGALLTLEKLWRDLRGKREPSRLGGLLTGGLTFLFVNLAWVLFRVGTIEEGILFIQRLLGGGWEINQSLSASLEKLVELRIMGRFGLNGVFEAYPALPVLTMMGLLLGAVFGLSNTQEKVFSDRPVYGVGKSLMTILLLVWCIISLSDVSEFLYFNF